MTSVVYHPRMRVGWPWLSFLHPFDFERPDNVLKLLREQAPSKFHLRQPESAVTDQQLQLVHCPAYLGRLRRSSAVATVLEVPMLGLIPFALLRRAVVTPQRFAVASTLLAGRLALEEGLSFSLAGGFHHAKPASGEGFCLFSDIGYCLARLRADGHLSATDSVLYLDLDAHQGNGVCHMFADDPRVKIFDIYNADAYPFQDRIAKRRIDIDLPVRWGTQDQEYLAVLRAGLAPFLAENPAKLAIYNAGTDPFFGDSIGGLRLSAEAIFERDAFVIDSCRQYDLPVLFLPSGGYSDESCQLICQTILNYL